MSTEKTTDAPRPATPTLDRITALRPQLDAIGGFLEWLDAEGVHLMRATRFHDEPFEPDGRSIQQLLADHFRIDRAAEDREMRELLEYLRVLNGGEPR